MDDAAVTTARWKLRSNRVLEMLGQSAASPAEERNRNLLLSKLTADLVDDEPVSESEIDAAVSIGIARISESTIDQLGVMLTAAEVLARAGQFARLKILASVVHDLGERLREDRPYFAVCTAAFALAARGELPRAEGLLVTALGIGNAGTEPPVRVLTEWTGVSEVFLANAFRRWLADGVTDRLEVAQTVALRSTDGLLLALASLFLSYARVASRASIDRVVPTSEPVFREPRLERYLRARNVRTLFPAQIAAIESGVLGEGSKLVAMPTSSGKTFLAELRIAAELARTSGSRAVYLAPYRVLANQVASALQYGLGRLNLKSVDLGGAYDVSLDELFQNDELPDVAVMTPERFDALLRLADSGRRGHAAAAELLESLSLIVLDEVQLIGRPHRGAKYELFLTRVRQRLPSVSILGLAALSQGEVNLAEWLEATLTVPNSGRPTGLIEVLWKPDGSLYQRFEGKQVRVGVVQRDGTAIDAAARLMASMRPESCPVLCVEVTRDYAESVIRKVAHASPRAGDRWRASLTANRRAVLDEVASIASAMLGEQHELGELIRQGLAYHHAGLPSNLLREIENLLRHRLVRALGATTTVAEGADLPFQVLIIPHLNFGGQSARLDRELYQNIVGRAGRVNASIEGIVIVLGSNSPSFRNFVEDELWAQTGRRTLVGQLPAALSLDSRLEDYRVQREVRSQVLAWVGDPGSYSDDQARTLAAKTFSWRTTTHRQRETLEAGVHNVLLSLVESGLAEVGSPFQLTELGQRARLAGIGPASCLRLASALQRIGLEESVATLQEAARVNLLMSRVIGELLFETEEVMEHSLWLRRQGFQDGELVPHHDGYWG